MSPGCSERERVRGAMTMRCLSVTGPICTGVNNFCSAVVGIIGYSDDQYVVTHCIDGRGDASLRRKLLARRNDTIPPSPEENAANPGLAFALFGSPGFEGV